MSTEEGSAAGAASSLSTAVAASVIPMGCAYGCAVGLLWLIGGGMVGLALALLLRHL